MTKIDLDELERTARGATQGDWVTYTHDHDDRAAVDVHVMIDTGEIVEIALEASEPDGEHIAAASPPVVLALIAHIRELQAFIAATPDAGLQADKLHRDDLPELFIEGDGNALYMDEAKRRILEKGAVLP